VLRLGAGKGGGMVMSGKKVVTGKNLPSRITQKGAEKREHGEEKGKRFAQMPQDQNKETWKSVEGTKEEGG